MEFEQKFIGFVDILGFSSLVEGSESGEGISLSELTECLTKLGTKEDEERYKKHGPTICPESNYIRKDLNFKITQITDCVIVSSEISPSGLINLVSHCWGAVIGLSIKGTMCRGYITKGSIIHHDNRILGTGYQKAYSSEASVTAFKQETDERGTPFVEIDPDVCEYVEQLTDDCVKEMFSRMVKKDGSSAALFPFQRISHSFMISDFFGRTFDPEEEKRSNDIIRNDLKKIKERVLYYVDPSNKNAVKKARHYVKAIDDQLVNCDKTDEMIDRLCDPFPADRFN